MAAKKGTPARKWYLSARFLGFMAVIFVLGIIITRNIYEPLLGMLIFWGTLLIPALVQQAWSKMQQKPSDKV